MKVVGTITMTKGQWANPHMKHDDYEDGWMGFYFEEFIIDWSIFPSGSMGKIYAETMHGDVPASEAGDREEVHEGGWLRLAYQYDPYHMIPIKESIMKTSRDIAARWQMVESEWFPIPSTKGRACVWMEGKPEEGKKISMALATLVIVAPEDEPEYHSDNIFVGGSHDE